MQSDDAVARYQDVRNLPPPAACPFLFREDWERPADAVTYPPRIERHARKSTKSRG